MRYFKQLMILHIVACQVLPKYAFQYTLNKILVKVHQAIGPPTGLGFWRWFVGLGSGFR